MVGNNICVCDDVHNTFTYIIAIVNWCSWFLHQKTWYELFGSWLERKFLC